MEVWRDERTASTNRSQQEVSKNGQGEKGIEASVREISQDGERERRVQTGAGSVFENGKWQKSDGESKTEA